jgi:glycosyltransferase involved in cell wall biosynthesis
LKIDEYIQFVNDKALNFLRDHLPWDLDGNPAPIDSSVKSLVLDAKQSQEAHYTPKFSIITPLYNTPPVLLEQLLLSIQCQSYLNWELILRDDASTKKAHLDVAQAFAHEDPRIKLIRGETNLGIGGSRNACIENATGDFIMIVDHDDLIHPRSLILFWKHLINDKNLSLIYTNECKIDAPGKLLFDFYFKPEFDSFTLLRNNYICHLSCISIESCKRMIEKDGYLFARDLDGAEDHDFFLRLSKTDNFNAKHIPLFPYYWRTIEGSTASEKDAKPNLNLRRKKFLYKHCEELYGKDFFELRLPDKKSVFQILSIFPKFRDSNQKILVIVPFHNSSDLTIKCLEKLKLQSSFNFLKVCLVDNNSKANELKSISDWCDSHKTLDTRIHSYPYAFNFAKINNEAFETYSDDCTHVLFLNNDVEIDSTDALEVMASHLTAHPECAFTGILLRFPHGPIQHGGMRVMRDITGSGQFSIAHSAGAEELIFEEKVAMGVTFACAMSKVSTFRNLGKLDEWAVPNGYGDVDICLRAAKNGLKCHYFGTLNGIHHESVSRSRVNESIEFLYVHEKYALEISRWRYRSFEFSQTGYSEWGQKSHNRPLRYKIADNINDKLKMLGILHKPVKYLFGYSKIQKKLK